MTQEGMPIKLEGDKIKWLKKRPEGVMVRMLDGGQGEEELMKLCGLFGEFINDLVPFSLQFFMGAI